MVMMIQKKSWKILAAITVSFFALLCAGVFTIHTLAFRNWARQKIIQQVTQKTGTRPRIQSLDFRFFPFTADFYGVVVDGTEPARSAPLFQAQRIRITLRILPLLRGEVQIDGILLEKPQARILVDAQGRSNLPAIPQSTAGSDFQIAVHYVQIRDGSLAYDDLQIPLGADLYDLQAQLTLLPLTNTYRADLRYARGRIVAKDFNPLDHSFELHITADSTRCRIDQWKMVTASSQLEGSGVIRDYAHPNFKGVYEATISSEEIGFLLKTRGFPSGAIALQGDMKYEAPPGDHDFLDAAFLDGTLQSAALAIPAANSSLTARQLQGSYTLDHGFLRFKELQGQLLQGSFHSAANVIDLRKDSGSLHVDLRNASLGEAVPLFSPENHHPQLRSLVNVELACNWKNGLRNFIVEAQGTFSSHGPRAMSGDIPIDGAVAATYDRASDKATSRDSFLRTGTTQLRASGTISQNSVMKLHVNTSDLHELMAISAGNGAARFIQSANLGELRGAATFDGQVTGPVRDPRFEGQLVGTEIVLHELRLNSLRTHLILDARQLRLDSGSLESDQGRLQLTGSLPLSNWTPNKFGSLALDLKAERLSVAAVEQLAHFSYPVQGLLNGEVHLSGSLDQPKGNGHLALANGTAYEQTLSDAAVDFETDSNLIRMNAGVKSKVAAIEGHGSYEIRTRRYELNIDARDINPSQLRLQNNFATGVVGTLSAHVTGSGTFDDPQLQASVQSSSLQTGGESFSDLRFELAVQRKIMNIEATSTVEKGQVHAKGTLALTGNYQSKIAVDSGRIDIGPLLQKYLPGAGDSASGEVELHASLSGPLKDLAQLQAHVELPTVRISGKSVDLQNTQPIRLDYAQGILNIRDASLKGKGTDVQVSGSLGLRTNGELDLSAQGKLDLKILQDWLEGSSASGQAKLQLQVKGTRNNPDISGAFEIANGAYSSDSLPIGLESMDGTATIHGRHVQIEKLSGAAGGGTIAIGGSLDFGENPIYALTVNADSARVRQNGIRAVLDADLSLFGSGGAQSLNGRVVIHKLAFNEGSDLGEIISQISGDETVSEPPAFEKKIKVNVTVQTDEDLDLSSSQLSVAGSANLRVVGTAARPVVLGRLSLTGGEVFFLGKRFELQGGTIGFANTARTRPLMNLYVSTTIEQYNITISLSGPLEKLKASYTSDPSLPTADIINLLAFGQTTTEAASKSSTPASVGAESAVAGAVGGQVAGQLQKVSGISQLTIDPLAGNNQNPGSQITIQQRVTGNLLVTFSTDITSAQSQTVQLKYQAKRNVSVSILRDENGGYGLDVRFHKSF